MSQLHHAEDQAVKQVVEEAAGAACRVLDDYFPGGDASGVSSNFQGLLSDVLMHMLKGRSLLDRERGHHVLLRQLVIDDSLFCDSKEYGESFAVTRPGEMRWGPVGSGLGGGCKPLGRAVLAMAPDGFSFEPIERLGDSWTTRERAVQQALQYARANSLTPQDVREQQIRVRRVCLDSNRETGATLG